MDDRRMRILLVEDDPDDAILLREMLSEADPTGFELEHTERLDAALQRIESGRFDVVLTDLGLPDSQGLDTFLQMHGRAPEIPIVVLTGLDDETVAVRAVHEGAQDYLMKGQADGALLVRSMRYAIERQRTRHYRALLTERERFDTAIAHMSDGIVVTDGEWRITSTNRAACLLLNLPERGCERMPLDEALAPFRLSVQLPEVRAASERVTIFEISRPHTRPPLFVDARVTRLFDSADRPESAVVILRDVTRERRGRELRATFFTMVSHKLRTPLAILLGYLELCGRLGPERVSDELAEVLSVCHAEASRLREILGQLLDFKALSEGQLGAEAEPTDIAAVVAGVQDEVRRRHAPRKIQIATQISSDATHAHCNPEHLGFVLERLLDNAAKFGDKEPVQIALAVEPKQPSWLAFSLSDNGPGIPHEYYDRIFDPFVQVEDRPTGEVPGLGVGLCLARQVIEAYGGSISVRSSIGEGSTFSFTLPAAALPGSS